MNKAFVREPDDLVPLCPNGACGARGVPVAAQTVTERLGLKTAPMASPHLCPEPSCDVVYFDAWGTLISRVDIPGVIPWPKDPAGPLCPCTGITPAAIESDGATGNVERIRQLISQAEAAPDRCAQHTLDGQTCETLARRLFLRHAE